MRKLPTLFLLLFGIIIFASFCIVFLWHEHLSFNEKINDQKITNFVLIIAAIVTSISILLLWKQLQEQQLNRLNNVLPELFPKDLDCILEECEHEIHGIKGVHIYPKEGAHLISINNIGIGSAKQIETKWIYKIAEVDNLIQNTYSFFPRMSKNDSDFISFLKPDDREHIGLPIYYILCCGLKLNLKSGNSGSDGKFGIKPSLRLNISYLDINNRKFEKEFNVLVQAYNHTIFLKFKQIKTE